MGVANMLYIYRDSFRRSMQLTAFFVFVVFSSISSGPMLSVLVQLALTAWDRLLWFMRFKWLVLGFLGIMAMLLLQIASQFHILDFIIENLMFNPETAPGRIINFEYGMAEVYRHPVFGIGLGDWVRPWDRPATFDNFWLNYWMRFGMPSFAFLVLALVISASRIAMQTTLTRREARLPDRLSLHPRRSHDHPRHRPYLVGDPGFRLHLLRRGRLVLHARPGRGH